MCKEKCLGNDGFGRCVKFEQPHPDKSLRSKILHPKGFLGFKSNFFSFLSCRFFSSILVSTHLDGFPIWWCLATWERILSVFGRSVLKLFSVFERFYRLTGSFSAHSLYSRVEYTSNFAGGKTFDDLGGIFLRF